MIIKPLMLAKTYAGQDVTGWYMSEKLDGVWARYIDGKFYSRLGNQFITPKWFCSELPKGVILDGELWAGRGTFQSVTGIARKNVPIDEEWNTMRFIIFDSPSPLPFSKRYELLDHNIGLGISFQVIFQLVIDSMERFKTEYQRIVEGGGEGLMLKDPYAPYVHGRVSTFLKHKPNITDEATVIGYTKGMGKYLNQVGALECKWRDKIILLGSGLTNGDRNNPPKIGSIVTFRYDSLTLDSMPRNPRYIATRNYE